MRGFQNFRVYISIFCILIRWSRPPYIAVMLILTVIKTHAELYWNWKPHESIARQKLQTSIHQGNYVMTSRYQTLTKHTRRWDHESILRTQVFIWWQVHVDMLMMALNTGTMSLTHQLDLLDLCKGQLFPPSFLAFAIIYSVKLMELHL